MNRDRSTDSEGTGDLLGAGAGWGGGMGGRVRGFDWARTPLGEMGGWSESLRTAVGMCLGSRFPMFVWWGPELINIYNDAYAPLLGARHPGALGRPAREVWGEVWGAIEADVARVMRGEGATWYQRAPLVVERHGYPEEAWFTWSHSPIPDGRGGVGGLLCVVTEETGSVRAERERDRAAEQTRTVLESITDAFFAVDREWRFTYANAQALRVLNRTWDELVGQVIWETYPGLAGTEFERAYRRAAGERVAGSVTAYYPDHERWYEVHAYPAPDGGVSVYFRNVTERKRDEETLRELAGRLERHSRLFEQISSTTPDFIYVFDLAGRFLYANRRLLEVWGRTAEEAVGKNLYELGYPKWHADMHMAEIRQVIETKRPIKGEVPFTGGSGISGVYEYIFTPVLGEDGRVEVIAGTTRDVTDRQRVERELAEAKAAAETGLARWRAVVENMAEGVIVIGADGVLLEWNRAALAMHGYTSVDDVRRTIGAFAPVFEILEGDGSVVPFERWPIPRMLRGEAFTNWEVRLRRVDGSLDRVVSYSGVPVRDQRGEVGLMLLTLHDVTEERRAQGAVRASEGLLRSFLDNAPPLMGVVEVAADGGDILHLLDNAAAEQFFGVGRGELAGQWAREDLRSGAENVGRWVEAYREAKRTGRPVRFLFRAAGETGEVGVWWDVAVSYVGPGDGGRDRCCYTAIDITERRRVEEERETLLESERAARVEAERAGRMKDEFLATLSHELRTPLNAIVGWSQILKVQGVGPEDVREGVETIERNARAQARIIEDLLDMSRIVSGKIRLEVGRVDVAEVVRAAVETVRPAAEGKGVRLQVVAEVGTGAAVMGDASRLQQVFWNLLTNAVKFTPRAGRVQVLAARVGSGVEVSVADTGEGIRAEFLPHVFERFRQADASTTRRHGGLGLGLAIVKQLVELHGGSVRVASAGEGQGSTFTVMLPVASVRVEEAGGEARPDAGEDGRVTGGVELGRVDLSGLRVLVVDDEPDARGVVKRVLEGCGAVVMMAGSAREGLALVGRERPDVLVSDIGMPEEDGYGLIRRVRGLGAEGGGDVPAVALTAYARAEDRVRAIRAGFQMHVVKPVEPAELIAVVASLAGRVG